MTTVGDEVAGYRIEEVMAEGDLGPTWRVSREGEHFSVRVLAHSDEAFRERLRRAGEAQKEVHNPHVVAVREVIETPDGPGVVSEHVDGGDLAGWIAKGPHPIGATVEVFDGLLQGLQACHGAGILHRNLKPDKVLMTATGAAKVNDFVFGRVDAGSSPRLTALDHTFGTPQFMAPEQFYGAAKVDQRADLYSAGCIFYEMLTGTRAFPGINLMEIFEAVSDGACTPLTELRPALSPELIAFVGALMGVKADERPENATAALERLRSLETLEVEVEAQSESEPDDDDDGPMESPLAPEASGSMRDTLPPPPPPPVVNPEEEAAFEAELVAIGRRRQAMQVLGCGCMVGLVFGTVALGTIAYVLSSLTS